MKEKKFADCMFANDIDGCQGRAFAYLYGKSIKQKGRFKSSLLLFNRHPPNFRFVNYSCIFFYFVLIKK